MKQDNNREQWMSGVMNSTKDMNKAAADPLMYDKVMAKLGNKRPAAARNIYPRWAAAAVLLMMVNIASVMYVIKEVRHTNTKTDVYQSLSGEMELQSTYNY